MNIVEFFQQSTGKWFSQRTSHHLAFQQFKGGKSDIVIEMLSENDPTVLQLCQKHNADPALAACGVRITWNGTMELDDEKQQGSTVLVPIVDPDHPNQGKLLRQVGYDEKTPVAAQYIMGNDDVLTLITERETLYTEERLWFASPNLRLRTSLLKQPDGFSVASFCSEIRMGGAPAASSSTTGSAVQSK